MDFGIQSAFWQIVGRLGLAMLVGSALGINRNLRRKPAGVRTHALVSLGTALVTLIAFEGTGHDPGATSRVVQGLVTGIGFLGAGVRAFGDSDIPQVPPLSAAGEPHVILPHEEAPRGAAAVLACEEVRASTPGAPCARRFTRALRQGSIPWSRRGTSRQEPAPR